MSRWSYHLGGAVCLALRYSQYSGYHPLSCQSMMLNTSVLVVKASSMVRIRERWGLMLGNSQTDCFSGQSFLVRKFGLLRWQSLFHRSACIFKLSIFRLLKQCLNDDVTASTVSVTSFTNHSVSHKYGVGGQPYGDSVLIDHPSYLLNSPYTPFSKPSKTIVSPSHLSHITSSSSHLILSYIFDMPRSYLSRTRWRGGLG
jgi:hypothetical protein